MARYQIALAVLAAMMAPGIALADPIVAYTSGDPNGNGDFQTGWTRNTEFGSSAPGSSGSTSTYAPAGWYGSGYDLYFKGSTASSDSAYSQYGGTNEKLYNNLTGIWASAGNYYVALDGDSTVQGAIWTTVSGLTAGATYNLSFDWAVSELQSATAPYGLSESLQVSLYNGTASASAPSSTAMFTQSTSTVSIASGGFQSVGLVTMTFVATAASETLKFLSVGAPATGAPPIALLDNVSVTAVPEPTTMVLMASGIGLMGLLRRRRASQHA